MCCQVHGCTLVHSACCSRLKEALHPFRWSETWSRPCLPQMLVTKSMTSSTTLVMTSTCAWHASRPCWRACPFCCPPSFCARIHTMCTSGTSVPRCGDLVIITMHLLFVLVFLGAHHVLVIVFSSHSGWC